MFKALPGTVMPPFKLVLIVLAATGSGRAGITTSGTYVQFDNQQQCEAAAKALTADSGWIKPTDRSGKLGRYRFITMCVHGRK